MQFSCIVIWVSDLILNLFTDFDAILFEGKHGKKKQLMYGKSGESYV